MAGDGVTMREGSIINNADVGRGRYVGDGVRETVSVGIAVGKRVGVGVKVGDGVKVEVGAEVGVAVEVGRGVEVKVGVEVGKGMQLEVSNEQATSQTNVPEA